MEPAESCRVRAIAYTMGNAVWHSVDWLCNDVLILTGYRFGLRSGQVARYNITYILLKAKSHFLYKNAIGDKLQVCCV